jgi:inhibitor of KinA sporulation pathway (predicted exonuclease)
MSAKRKWDKILVVDVEATCWDQDNRPDNPVSEIIEVGLCFLDVKTLERSGKQSMFVKPRYSSISPYCESLTSIMQADVDNGKSFEDVCGILRESCLSNKRVWASWGDYDRIIFDSQCKSYGVDYPFGRTHINVKTLFAITKGMELLKEGMALKKEYALPDALSCYGKEFEGRLHRGDDDAFNIAGVLGLILNGARCK